MLKASHGQVTLKENAPESELQKAREQSKEHGGKITHEYTLIKGFLYAIPSFLAHPPFRL
jgi:hypothetical protein